MHATCICICIILYNYVYVYVRVRVRVRACARARVRVLDLCTVGYVGPHCMRRHQLPGVCFSVMFNSL